jgi:hypothetical protein
MNETSWYVAARGAVLPWDSPDATPWPRHPWGRKPARKVGDSSADHLPEEHQYRDDGCEIAPKCLECPLPDCRFSLPPKRAGAILRAAQLRPLLAAGLTADECAAEMGISRRTVYRLKSHVPASLPLMDAEARERQGLQAWEERQASSRAVRCGRGVVS